MIPVYFSKGLHMGVSATSGDSKPAILESVAITIDNPPREIDYLSYDDLNAIPPHLFHCRCRILNSNRPRYNPLFCSTPCMLQQIAIAISATIAIGGCFGLVASGMSLKDQIGTGDFSPKISTQGALFITFLIVPTIATMCFVTFLFWGKFWVEDYNNRKRAIDFQARILTVCQEAGGDMHAKILNLQHLYEFMIYSTYDHLKWFDYAQTKVLYLSTARQALISRVAALNNRLREIWSTANALHTLSPEEFLNRLNNISFREHLESDLDLKDAVLNCLPETYRTNREIQNAIKNPPSLFTQSTAASSRQIIQTSLEDYQTPRHLVKFSINQELFTFEKESLITASSFFKKVLEGINNREFPTSQEDPALFVELSIPAEDQGPLAQLLTFTRQIKTPSSASTIEPLYHTTKTYGLEILLRNTVMKTISPGDYFDYLLMANYLDWGKLQNDLIISISKEIENIRIESFASSYDRLHLIQFHQYAKNDQLSVFQRTLEEQFISAFKYVIDKFKNREFTGNYVVELHEIFFYSVNIEPLLSVLDFEDTKSFEFSLYTYLKAYALDPKSPALFLTTLVDIFEKHQSPCLLRRTLVRLFKNYHIKALYDQFYTVLNPMPNSLRQLLED